MAAMSSTDPFDHWLKLHAALIAKEKELASVSVKYSCGEVDSVALGDLSDEVRRMRAAADAALAEALAHMRAQRKGSGGGPNTSSSAGAH